MTNALALAGVETFRNRIVNCDAMTLARSMPSQSIQTIITSPPYYGLRDYGVTGQIGLEQSPESYIARLVELFRELRRALRDDGTLWVNLGDSYSSGGGDYNAGSQGINSQVGKKGFAGLPDAGRNKRAGLPPKNLLMIPARVALALQVDGWILRQDIIWNKPAPMPESVKDRCTKSHEYIFLLAKSGHYYFDNQAIKEPALGVTGGGFSQKYHSEQRKAINGGAPSGDLAGFSFESRNKRSVWTVNSSSFPDVHFATFPLDLVEPMVLAGSRAGDIVYDPFMGSGTTALVARKHKRDYIGSELNPEYVDMATDRLRKPFEKRKRQPKSEPLDTLPLFAGLPPVSIPAESG